MGLTAREIAEPNTILRAVVGSTLHGLNHPGQDDRDEMGVCVEPLEYVIGLKRFEQWTYRTRPEGVRSGPGDLDLVVYSLRKYARLAAQGNPTILLLLFAPTEFTVHRTPMGERLQAAAPMFVSRACGPPFQGYMRQQYQRLIGERGQKRVKRPELEEAYGYDTKYAMHMLRLGMQGVELMETGRLELPMIDSDRALLMAVRHGQVTLAGVYDLYERLDYRLERAVSQSALPDAPDYDRINQLLLSAYLWPRTGAA